MAERIPILMQYNGKWSELNKYEDFQVDGILIPLSCSYDSLLDIITKQLNGTTENSILDIKYVIGDGYPPLKIKDDMTLLFYLELKIKEPYFKSYPLCITRMEKRETGESSKASSSELGVIGVEPKTTSLLLNQDIPLVNLDETIINMMNYMSLVSKQTIDNLNNRGKEVEQDKEELITNPSTGSSISSFNAGASTSAVSDQSQCFDPYSGACSASNAATSNTSMGFGLITGAASGSVFKFGSPATATPSHSVFATPNSSFTFGSSPSNNDQMNMEDSMAEDTVQATTSTAPVFDQQSVTPPSSGFVFGSTTPSGGNQFGSTAPSGGNPFVFGSQPNLATPQNQSPFQASGSLEFNAGGSFSLGTGGGDKSNRKFVRVSRKARKK